MIQTRVNGVWDQFSGLVTVLGRKNETHLKVQMMRAKPLGGIVCSLYEGLGHRNHLSRICDAWPAQKRESRHLDLVVDHRCSSTASSTSIFQLGGMPDHSRKLDLR